MARAAFLTGRSGHSPTLLPKNEISIMKHVWQNHLKNYSQNCSVTFIQLEHKFGNMYCSIFLLHFCNILTIWQIILDWRKNCQKSRNVPQQIQNEMAITCRSWRVFLQNTPGLWFFFLQNSFWFSFKASGPESFSIYRPFLWLWCYLFNKILSCMKIRCPESSSDVSSKDDGFWWL